MSDSPTEEMKTPAAPVAETPAEKPAESPPAEQDSKSPPSTLDAVKAALGKKPVAESSPVEKSPEKEGSADPEPDDGKEFTEPPTKEELSRLHSKTRRRMQWFMDQMSAKDAELQNYKPEAESFRKIRDWVSDAGLSSDEVNTGLEIMRLMKRPTDAARALELLEPYVNRLKQATGAVLPPDLQEQARGGYISEQHASELAQRRANEAALRQQMEADRQADAQRQQQAAQQAVITELSTWESSKSASDPDYTAKKSSFVQEALAAKWARGERPRTPQEAREQAEKTYAEVNQRLGALLPKPTEIKPVTGAAAPAAMPTPNSTLDVIRRVVGR